MDHLNNIKLTMKFTMEIQKDLVLPLQDVLGKKISGSIRTLVYRKPKHYESIHSIGANIEIILLGP